MEPNTTSTEYAHESQAQYTQASSGVGGEMTVSLSSHSPYLPPSHLQGLGNPSMAQLGSLSNSALAPNHSSLPSHSTFQLDLHPGTPLTQSEQQQLSMLWFSTSSLRPHQGSLSALSGLTALPPDLQHCRPSAVSPDHVPSTQDILTPTSDSLIQVSVALPSYHSTLRNLVGPDDQVHGNSLAGLGNQRLDPSASLSSLDNSQSAQIHRSDLLSHNDISLSTLEAVRAISTIYSIAPSQGATSDVTASVNSSHGAIGTNDDATGANSLHPTEYCNIDDLNAAAVAAAAHIPLKSEMISIGDGSGHVSGLGLEGISPHHLQAELVYRNHDGLDMNRSSGTIQIPFLRSEDVLKGDKVDELPILTLGLPKKFMDHADSVAMQHDGLVDRMEQCATELLAKDVSQPTGEKLDGLTETVACFKCRLCPFICLNKKGVHEHLRDQHADAIVSSEESEVEADVDVSQNVVSNEPMSQEHETITEPSETDVANSKDAKVVMHPTAKGRKFICGKCQKGFPNLHPCRAHMMQDHGLRFDKVRLEKLSDQQSVREKQSPSSPVSKKRPRGRPRKSPNDLGKENTSRKALSARRKQKLPRKMKSLDESSSDNEPLPKKKKNAKRESKPATRLTGSYSVGNGSAATDSDSRTNIPKISSPLKRRGRPKGSKNTGITALKRKNPKLKVDLELGYRCEVDGCAIRMKSIDNLEYHRRCHIGLATGFTCPECHEKFDHWRNISVHLWRSHVIDMELFACDMCSYKTYSYSKLMNMHKRIHSEERPFLCDTCGKGFKTSKQLRNHKVIHLDKRRHRSYRSGECDICHRFFSDKRMLRVHKDTVHNKLRPFLCNYCGYAASCRSTLKMHMRQHTGEKPFSCELCPYRTADHNSLRRHKMRHSGVKPYKCPFCTYACIQSSTYKTHLKNKHPGQDEGLMYSCNLCAFRTIKKDNFVTHMADHKAGTIPVSEDHSSVQIVATATPAKPNTVAVNPEHTVLVQTTQAIPHLAQLDTIPGNMTAAQVMFSAIEDIRQKIAIAAQSYPLEVGPTDRYPILLGQLKGSHLENTTVVHIDPNQTLDTSQLTHQEFLVHESMTQEQVQQLTHSEVIQQHEQPE